MSDGQPAKPVLDPALRRALLVARAKREQRGACGDGRIELGELAPEEALALDGLLSPRKPLLPGGTLRIALSQFEAALRSCGEEPHAAYEHVAEAPLRDLPAERLAHQTLRTDFRAWLLSHEAIHSRPALTGWFDRALRQGRVRAQMQPLVEQALRVLAILPAQQPIQRAVLAATTLGDPHALDVDTPLHGLLLSMLASDAKLAADASPREVWWAWNVLVDPVSSNVAVLNLPLRGDTKLAAHIQGMRGTHVILTYGQLAAGALRWPFGVECFSCENPSVLIAAEHALGDTCPPLLCTAGRPSDAARLLFSIAHSAGAQIRHHGDFDQAGVQILRDLEDRYSAVPWRFDLESLSSALLTLSHTTSHPLARTLERAVEQLATPLTEELVIDDLVSDLRSHSRPRQDLPVSSEALRLVLATDDADARREAGELVHLLGARGMTEFRDLVPDAPSQGEPESPARGASDA